MPREPSNSEIMRSIEKIDKRLEGVDENVQKALRRQARDDERFLNINEKVDKIDKKVQSWDMRVISAMGVAVISLVAVVWEFIIGSK